MVFPITKLPVKVELQLGGTWTDITAYTRVADGVTITRGRRDESGSFEPGECQLVLNNQAGRFSPRNPTGPYYGVLGRNTPIRVSVLAGPVRGVGADVPSRFDAPDTAGLSITGDIDLRADLRTDWRVGATLLSKNTLPSQLSYGLSLNTGGVLRIGWSTTGSDFLAMDSLVPLPRATGRQAVRATLDVDNGAGGRTATFYYADTMAGTWIQLGAAVVTAGTTSIFDSTSVVSTARSTAGCEVYSFQVLQGIAGTLRANPDFTIQAEGATSFVDAAGNTWTAQGTAAITARRYRFYGEVPSWPQQWDISERDAWVSISAAGVLRRLGQGAAPLQGPIQRAVLRTTPAAVAYWPFEDADGSTSIASGLPAVSAMGITGTPRFAASDTIKSSGPLPEMALASFTGSVSTYTPSGTTQVRFMLAVPAAGDTNTVLLRFYTTGTAPRWDLRYGAGLDGLTLEAFDSLGTLLSTGGGGFEIHGQQLLVMVQLVQNGANIDWTIFTAPVDANATGIYGSIPGTLNTRTVGAVTTVQISPDRLLDTSVIGHVMVHTADMGSTLTSALRGYTGEAAGTRVARLCSEEGIAFAGAGADSVAMGTQTPATLLETLAECETSDMGQLFESRDFLGLAYRTRLSRAVQTPALALNYSALRELNPVEDDQNTRNDITVSRINGSSARATVDTGPLSTQAPPNGVGRYDDEVELSLFTDAQCAGQANWRVTQGTIDEPRYPVLSAQLAGTAFKTLPTLIGNALDVEHGDRITVTGTPVWVPPGTIDQHTIGQVETLGVREYQIDYVCQPATPTGSADIWDATTFRWAGTDSVLNASLTSGATTTTVATVTGPLWTTTDVPFDITVGGEQITVGAVSGAASPQTFFSLTRAVNGVVKAHLAGESVQISDPTYYAL